jgi:hypothetical protein
MCSISTRSLVGKLTRQKISRDMGGCVRGGYLYRQVELVGQAEPHGSSAIHWGCLTRRGGDQRLFFHLLLGVPSIYPLPRFISSHSVHYHGIKYKFVGTR